MPQRNYENPEQALAAVRLSLRVASDTLNELESVSRDEVSDSHKRDLVGVIKRAKLSEELISDFRDDETRGVDFLKERQVKDTIEQKTLALLQRWGTSKDQLLDEYGSLQVELIGDNPDLPDIPKSVVKAKPSSLETSDEDDDIPSEEGEVVSEVVEKFQKKLTAQIDEIKLELRPLFNKIKDKTLTQEEIDQIDLKIAELEDVKSEFALAMLSGSDELSKEDAQTLHDWLDPQVTILRQRLDNIKEKAASFLSSATSEENAFEVWKLNEAEHPKEARQLRELTTEISEALADADYDFLANAQLKDSFSEAIRELQLIIEALRTEGVSGARKALFLEKEYLYPAVEEQEKIEPHQDRLHNKRKNEAFNILKNENPKLQEAVHISEETLNQTFLDLNVAEKIPQILEIRKALTDLLTQDLTGRFNIEGVDELVQFYLSEVNEYLSDQQDVFFGEVIEGFFSDNNITNVPQEINEFRDQIDRALPSADQAGVYLIELEGHWDSLWNQTTNAMGPGLTAFTNDAVSQNLIRQEHIDALKAGFSNEDSRLYKTYEEKMNQLLELHAQHICLELEQYKQKVANYQARDGFLIDSTVHTNRYINDLLTEKKAFEDSYNTAYESLNPYGYTEYIVNNYDETQQRYEELVYDIARFLFSEKITQVDNFEIQEIQVVDPTIRRAFSLNELRYIHQKIDEYFKLLTPQARLNGTFEEISESRARVLPRLSQYIEFLDSDPKKEVKDLTPGELVDEILTARIDPFEWASWKTANVPSRNTDLVNRFMQQVAFKELDDPDAELDRIVHKVRLQLATLDNKLVGNDIGIASVDRSGLYEQLAQRQMSRAEVMKATTHHPVWGHQIRDILKFVVETAATRAGEQTTVGYKRELSYDVLASEKGRGELSKAIRREFPNYHPEAHAFADVLFTSMDMLTIPLRELQKQTKTRAHNGGIQDEDRVLLQDPFAGYIHRGYRYGGNKRDWTAWFLLYLQDIPPNAKVGPQDAKHGHDSTDLIRNMQRDIILHQEVYFDFQPVRRQWAVPLRGFCQSLFPDTRDMVTLGKNETLRIGNAVYDSKGNELLRIEGDRIVDGNNHQIANIQNGFVFDMSGRRLGGMYDAEIEIKGKRISLTDNIRDMQLYQLAEIGWQKMLEFAFKSLPENLSKHSIMEETEEGGKGGLINQWLSAAGKAKMFPGDHLKSMLVPMLTHFIYRIFAQYEGKTVATRQELQHEIIESLEHSMTVGGLSAYRSEMEAVIEFMRGDFRGMSDSLRLPSTYRHAQLDRYVDRWWSNEKGNRTRPGLMKGYGPRYTDADEEEYWDMKKRRKAPHKPASRSGDMFQPKEKASTGH